LLWHTNNVTTLTMDSWPRQGLGKVRIKNEAQESHFISCSRKVEKVTTPLLEECEDDTHTPKMGTWESFGTPETLKLDYRGQNTSHWGVLYIIGKLWKFRCRKWACMGHLDIFSTSYVQKKGRESNWQFDSRPLKVKNQLDPGVCRGSVTHRWKALKESYKFALDLVPIGGLRKKLRPCEILGVQTGTVSG
jgi:hypothetical protein